MASLEEIVVQLTAETASLKAEMQSATKVVGNATEKMDKAINEFSKNSGKNTSFMQQAFATMTGFLGSQAVLGVFGLVKDAAGALAGQIMEAGKEAAAEEAAFTRLATSLRLAGNYSKESVDGLVDFANEMEGVAQAGADVIASNLAMLSSLTRLDAEGLKKAQKSAIDLSAALGIDLDTASSMVAKAVNGNDMAFKKLGITMNLTGDATQNLANLTNTLNDRFGGSAAARMQTFGGALFSLKDGFGDMFKEIAKAITQNEVVIAVMSKVGEIFASITEQFKSNGAEIRDGFGKAIIELIDTLIVLAQVADVAVRVLRGGFNALQVVAAALVDSVFYVVEALNGVADNEKFGFAETRKQWEETKSAFTDTTALEALGGKLQEIKGAASTAFEDMKGKPLEAVKSQEALGNAVQKTSDLTKQQEEVLKSFASGLASQNEAVSANYAFANTMLAEVNAQRMAMIGEDYAAQLTAQQEFFAQQQALRDSQYVSEQEQLQIARQNGLVTEEQYQAAKLALAQKYALDNAKQQTAVTQFNAQQEKTRADNFKGTMSTIASLSSSGNKELAAIGKAAAITNATIDGYSAVQKALASAPPPFNFALAGLVGAATAANVAKIAGVGLAGGIDSVPSSAGGGNNGDNFPAILKSGERVVPSETNQDLKEFLANQKGGANVNINVTVMPNTGLNNEQIGNLVEQFNSYFSSGGFKLLGAI
jgi:hypothetical protein